MFANVEIDAICIDLDNTLWPIDDVIVRAERVTFEWLDHHYPRVTQRYDLAAMHEVRMRIARELPHMRHDLTHLRKLAFSRHAEECGYGPELADRAFDVFFAARCAVSCYRDVEDALARLAAAYPLLAVTNGNACLELCGVAEYFVGCIYARDVGAAKPSPEVFAAAARRLEAEPGAILFVGDDPVADVHGAREAGMRTAWLNRTGKSWDGDGPGPDWQATDFDDLLATLQFRADRDLAGDNGD